MPDVEICPWPVHAEWAIGVGPPLLKRESNRSGRAPLQRDKGPLPNVADAARSFVCRCGKPASTQNTAYGTEQETVRELDGYPSRDHCRQAGFAGKDFVVLGHGKNAGADNNSNEHAANAQEIALMSKYLKEIAALMPDMDEVYVTGPGQEQFIHFLAEPPHYKNALCRESTSTKMGDEQLVAFIGMHDRN